MSSRPSSLSTPELPAPSPAAGARAVEDRCIPADTTGGPLPVRIHGRKTPGTARPLILHFHAGAFVSGTLDSGSAVPALLAEAGAVAVSLDYPLAPGHPFPQAVEAGYRALRWLQSQRQRLGGSTEAPLFVAGEEAGGNLAAAVALMARDRQGPALAGQILLSPMLDVCVATASQRRAKAGPVGCRWADGWHQYLPHAADAVHPYATPGAGMRLAGLPRTLLLTAQDDPLRDETLAYATRLREAGVQLEDTVLGLPTGWPLSYLDEAAPSSPASSSPPAWAGPVCTRIAAFLASA
jgi:acetyl esterase